MTIIVRASLLLGMTLALCTGQAVAADPVGKWTFTGHVYRPTCTLDQIQPIDMGSDTGSEDYDVAPMGSPLHLASGKISASACQSTTAVTFTFQGTADPTTPALFKNTSTQSPSNVAIYLQNGDTGAQIPANGNSGSPSVSVNVVNNAAVLNIKAGMARASNARVTVGQVAAAIVVKATYR